MASYGLTVSLLSLESSTLFGDEVPYLTSWSNFSAVGAFPEACPTTLQYRFFAMPMGMCLFLCVLTNWHWVAKWCDLGPMIFFDKVCIHQTDPDLKEAGIKSIGGILQNSKEVLLAWDSSYFERLWCTYELSAFLHKAHLRQKKPKITVIPVQLGGVVGAVLIGNMFVCGFAYFQ